MRRIILTLLIGLILASCAPQPASVSTNTPNPTALPPAHAPEIRFGLIGEPTHINVWQLFDESGASYANYAIRFEYWPRLYHLTPPEFNFQPLAAEGFPSAVSQDGELYSATVKLRSDLKWADEKPFTAEDVAFTANTSLKYELGYDWASYYPKDFLDHVEAIDSFTVKFYFKQKPNIGVWQYGVLQAPILQKAFWESRIQESYLLLPDEILTKEIEDANIYLGNVQARVDDLTAQVNALFLEGKENKSISGDLAKRQEELNYAKNSLNKLLEERAVKIISAQQALYAVDDSDEPTLGTWVPAVEENGKWVNEANLDFPFGQPNFDRAVYSIFEDQASAVIALENDEVDVLLSPNGIEQSSSNMTSPTRSNRFLVFNPNDLVLSEINLHQALSCLIDRNEISLYQAEFVQSSAWNNVNVSFPCVGLSKEQRIEKAIEFLKDAGYSWAQEPTSSQAGVGLKLPNGEDFPRITLLSTLEAVDVNRASMAKVVEQQALHLGIPMDVELTDLASLHYAVYSSEKYDLAIFGWRLSEYPSYLCEWFGSGKQFENNPLYGDNSSRLKSKCEALAVESNLEKAQENVFEIQSVLMEELPFIPLYSDITYDAFRNVQYPFESVLGGLSGLYGAPSYALPAK